MKKILMLCGILVIFSQNGCASMKTENVPTEKKKQYQLKLIEKNGAVYIDKASLPNIKKLKGIDLIKDEKLKKQVIEYLTFEAVKDYQNIYKYLSVEYLKQYFPGVKNSGDYKNAMSDSTVMEIYYLEVLSCTRLSENKYKIKVEYETLEEGSLLRNRNSYYFILENGVWKYDGLEFNDFKSEILDY
ncbi:hypothetical protein ACFL58_03200 [Elusimicrobiota bacterium]